MVICVYESLMIRLIGRCLETSRTPLILLASLFAICFCSKIVQWLSSSLTTWLSCRSNDIKVMIATIYGPETNSL